jgi:hypothetical protein
MSACTRDSDHAGQLKAFGYEREEHSRLMMAEGGTRQLKRGRSSSLPLLFKPPSSKA